MWRKYLQGKRHPPSEYVYIQQIYILQQCPPRTKKVLDSSSETWTFATTFSVTMCNADPPPLSPPTPLNKDVKDVNKEGKGF
jgi:hypothetical protein